MDRYAKLWASQKDILNSSQPSTVNEDEQTVVNERSNIVVAVVQRVVEEPVDMCNLPADPAQRRPISQFHILVQLKKDYRP